MDTRKRAVFAAVAGAMVSAFAATWYVDAENGNDAWNGQAAFADAVPANDVGPKKTLAVFTNLLAKGDTVYVAPGWYTNGVAETQFRFFSDKGNISLISTGSAADTFIGGAIDTSVNQATSPYGCGPASIVPLKMTGGNNLVRGITICNGRQLAYQTSADYYGGGAIFSGISNGDRMIDCVVSNCVANRGGGIMDLGHALRCRFTDNSAAEGAHGLNMKSAVNCIFENADGYAVYNGNNAATVLNCLFRGNKNGGFRSNGYQINVYNCVLLRGGTSTPKNKRCYFYNCLFDYDPTIPPSASEAISGTNGECRVMATVSLKFNPDGSPTLENAGVNAAVASYYNNNFPSAHDASEKNLDFAGNARTFGDAMDIGAFERNAETFDSNTWYVDAVNGDDSNSGRSAAQAFRTLARASTNALMSAGATVYVAEGVYNDGVVPASYGLDATDCRLLVGDGVDVIATGRRAETVIEGASDSGLACGIGPNAVRCCTMLGGSIRGFTLRNGNVNASPTTINGDTGGGVNGASSAYLYDCEIHHCNAVRGGGAANVTLVRCYVHDNSNRVKDVTPERSATATALFTCSAYNTVAVGSCYAGTRYMNCTLPSACWGGRTQYVNCYIGSDGAATDSVAATFTNCVCAGTFKSFSKHDGCLENTTCQFNSKWRATDHESAVVNTGDNALYSSLMPAGFLVYSNLDFMGGERFIEDRIDIGAGEMKPVGTSVILR